MKSIIYLLSICVINASLAYAMNNGNLQRINADSVITIDIKLDGNIYLENSSDNNVHLRTITKIDGRVLGLSNRDKISAYSVETEIKNNVLTLAPRSREKSWSIGINTISEENTHYIHIPKNMNVSINSNDAKIIVNGIFSLLKIANNKGETEVHLSKSKVHYLKAQTKNGEIWVNENAAKNEYNIISTGNSVVDVSTKSGLVTLELN